MGGAFVVCFGHLAIDHTHSVRDGAGGGVLVMDALSQKTVYPRIPAINSGTEHVGFSLRKRGAGLEGGGGGSTLPAPWRGVGA